MLLTIEQLRGELADRNLKEVSRRTGVHYITLTKLRSGAHENPRYETLKTLSDYLSK